nr:unnamed protein product [Callosobruchus chinensis]
MNRSQLFLYSILSCFILICIIDDSEELPGVDVKRLQLCPHKNPKAVGKLSNIRIKKVRDKMYVSYTITITRDINNDIESEAILTRCAASEALDTCERMRPLIVKHFCRIIKMENMPWSSFLNTLKPAVSCPIKKVNGVGLLKRYKHEKVSCHKNF